MRENLYYTPKPRIALVIGTYAAVPYIHLQLESWKRNYSHIPVLINDDSSHKQKELKELCDSYGVDFYSNKYRCRWTIGDMTAYTNGLQWASKNNADILVKMSRRFIPLHNWVDNLQNLAYQTQAPTFSQECRHFNFGFRTECLGLNVEAWLNSHHYNLMYQKVKENKRIFVEGYMHDLARDLIPLSSPVFRHYHDLVMQRETRNNGYAVWNIMADKRITKQANVIWHDADVASDYYKKAQEYGLTNYKLKDFVDPNQGGGLGEK